MIITLLLVAVVVLNVFVLAKLIRAFHRFALPDSEETISEEILPSVTVCITVRNETHAMTKCLEHVVASDYLKLEIIVLDDGSQDNTSILIKSFAHSGVRFVEGKSLPQGWLGKNYAQYLLAKEASGRLVFFMDVDTLLERDTISRAVRLMLSNQYTMLSIMPMRENAWRMDLLFTTMRHFWLLMRYKDNHPRATANAWIIERKLLLEQFNSDPSLAQSMKVETAIADKLASSDSYRLVLSNDQLRLYYEKEWLAQIETSIRILYLQSHKHTYEAIGLMLLLVVVLIPYVVWIITPWALAVVALQFSIALYYLYKVWPRFAIVGALVLPITILQELVLVCVSTYKYLRGTVTWKGRAVSLSDSEIK